MIELADMKSEIHRFGVAQEIEGDHRRLGNTEPHGGEHAERREGPGHGRIVEIGRARRVLRGARGVGTAILTMAHGAVCLEEQFPALVRRGCLGGLHQLELGDQLCTGRLDCARDLALGSMGFDQAPHLEDRFAR